MSFDPGPAAPPDWHPHLIEAARQFGAPVFGLPDPSLGPGMVAGYGGHPCDNFSIRYSAGTPDELDVTTSLVEIDGRSLLANLVIRNVGPEPELPWEMRIEALSVEIPVNGDPVQFTGMRASTGHWSLSGPALSRFVLIQGNPGFDLDGLGLVPVSIDPGDGTAPPTAH